MKFKSSKKNVQSKKCIQLRKDIKNHESLSRLCLLMRERKRGRCSSSWKKRNTAQHNRGFKSPHNGISFLNKWTFLLYEQENKKKCVDFLLTPKLLDFLREVWRKGQGKCLTFQGGLDEWRRWIGGSTRFDWKIETWLRLGSHVVLKNELLDLEVMNFWMIIEDGKVGKFWKNGRLLLKKLHLCLNINTECSIYL